MLEIILLLAPAYAEVNCHTGGYTGYRYNYANEAFEPKDALKQGKVWYKNIVPVMRGIQKGDKFIRFEYITTAERKQSETKCIYT